MCRIGHNQIFKAKQFMNRTPNLTDRSSPQEIDKPITISFRFSFIHCLSFLSMYEKIVRVM